MGKGDQDPWNLMISDIWWKGQGLLATWYVMKQRNGATRVRVQSWPRCDREIELPF